MHHHQLQQYSTTPEPNGGNNLQIHHHHQQHHHTNQQQQQQQPLQHDSKSISWCKKRTLYQSGGSVLRGGGGGSFGCSPHEFPSPSYFEGLEEDGGHPLEDEEDLNTVLQSYLESTSFSDGQSSSSPSQQSTDSGFAGDAGYSTPSSIVSSSYSNTNQNSNNNTYAAAESNNAAAYYYQQQTAAQQSGGNAQAGPTGGYYSDYGLPHAGGFLETANSYSSGGTNNNSSGYDSYVQQVMHQPEEDFHSSEDLSVIVDQVLNSIDDAQFDNYGGHSVGAGSDDYCAAALLPPSAGVVAAEEGLTPCDQCGTHNVSKECKNCEINQQQQHIQQQIQQQPTTTAQQNSQSSTPENKSSSDGSFVVGARQKSPKTVAAVQPMQRSVGVVEPRVVVKIPINKIRCGSSEEAGGEQDFAGVEEDDLLKGESVIEEVALLQPLLEQPPAMEVEEETREEKAKVIEEDVSSFSKDLMEEVVKDFEDEDFPESLTLSSSCPKKSSSSSHHHHKKKKHKRKKKKVCKCGGSKKRKRCESPVHHHQQEDDFADAMELPVTQQQQVNPLKIVRISESEEFKVQESSSLEAPVLERQVYGGLEPPPMAAVDSFGRVNKGSLLSFRDLALQAAAEAEDDNVMYSNDEEGGPLEDAPPLTPPPPTLHRHDSPEPPPCDKEEDKAESKEELADLLLGDVLPLSLPRELSPLPLQTIKKEEDPVLVKEEEKRAKTKMVLEKDPEDEWLYCQTKHCHFWTRKGQRMERHKRTHAGTEEDMYYVCPDCFAKFYSLAKMLKHDRKFHTGEKDYECKICEAEVTDIHVHMRVHRADKEFRCSTCPLTFRHKNSLVRHVFQHSGERPYKCQTCNSGFFSLSKLKEHVRRRHSPVVATTLVEPLPQAPTPIKTEGLLRQYPKLAPRISGAGDDDVVIVGLKPAPPANATAPRSLTLPAGGPNSRAILAAPSSIILPPTPAPQGVLSYLAQGPNGSVYLVTNPAPGANIFLGQGGEGILMQPQQPLFIPQSPVLIPQAAQSLTAATATAAGSNSNSTLFVVPAPVLNVPQPAAAQPPKPPPEKKLDILQQAILEIPDHFQSFEEE